MIASFGAALLVPAISQAALKSFQSPSGNIGCIGDARSVRCDIRHTSATPPKRPKNCTLEWGDAFEVDRTHRGHGVCHGDTALPAPNEHRPVLQYGRSIRLGAKLTCTSLTTGMTCRNAAGHGFTLSRTVIRLF